MTFRIETSVRGKSTIFTLSGRIDEQAIAELSRLFGRQTDYRHIVLDLKDVCVVDRDAISFLARCEADGIKLENLTPYIREWIEREKD
jgi:anti-anti-sigma regulatory factor